VPLLDGGKTAIGTPGPGCLTLLPRLVAFGLSLFQSYPAYLYLYY
jgi:hypothetical protein